MLLTTSRSSSANPLVIDTAFEISSWIRRMCASTSIVFSAFSGSGVICARSDVPDRV